MQVSNALVRTNKTKICIDTAVNAKMARANFKLCGHVLSQLGDGELSLNQSEDSQVI